jgi:hypothetical protein
LLIDNLVIDASVINPKEKKMKALLLNDVRNIEQELQANIKKLCGEANEKLNKLLKNKKIDWWFNWGDDKYERLDNEEISEVTVSVNCKIEILTKERSENGWYTFSIGDIDSIHE